MPWKPMRGVVTTGPGGLPGQRGRYLLLLGAPLVSDGPRWLHFSWRNESFCLRDYQEGQRLRQEPGLTASDIWGRAMKKIPAKGEYFHRTSDIDWWKQKLNELPTT